MSIEVGVVNRDDHETCIRALWGSKEKMINSPLFQEIVDRISYLESLNDDLKLIAEEESLVPWYRPIKFLFARLGLFSYKYVVSNRLDSLVAKYKAQMGLPVGFVVGAINDNMCDFIYDIREMVSIRNHKLNYKSDKYLEEAKVWKSKQ
ncbi:hypothetical protein YUBABA_00990 [Serratia phage vB_SmaM-Yubaba]|nr:hypothetical protein YUBABA_00990 [Serratia phage vB_SmaM-Yubaba]